MLCHCHHHQRTDKGQVDEILVFVGEVDRAQLDKHKGNDRQKQRQHRIDEGKSLHDKAGLLVFFVIEIQHEIEKICGGGIEPEQDKAIDQQFFKRRLHLDKEIDRQHEEYRLMEEGCDDDHHGKENKLVAFHKVPRDHHQRHGDHLAQEVHAHKEHKEVDIQNGREPRHFGMAIDKERCRKDGDDGKDDHQHLIVKSGDQPEQLIEQHIAKFPVVVIHIAESRLRHVAEADCIHIVVKADSCAERHH